MIRTINVSLNAAHPELPLVEATTFVGSPSSVFVSGVPKSCGAWRITAVSVAVTYPDNTTTTRAAMESAQGVWVATIPGTATSGRTVGGFRILADGEDENGAAITGYVLGFADFAVFSMLPVPAPGETFYLFRYFDAQPATPKKGDAAIIGGVLKYYNGTAWTPFADLSNYYTKGETDEAIERVAAYYITADAQGHAFATYAALVGATTYYSGGTVRVPTRNDYAVVLADETHDGAEYRYIYAVADGATTGQWEAQYPIETNDYIALSNKPQINGHTLTGEASQSGADLGLLSIVDTTIPISTVGVCAQGYGEGTDSTPGYFVGTGSSYPNYATLYENGAISLFKFHEGTEARILMPVPWLTRTSDTLALMSDVQTAVAAKQDALTQTQLDNIAAVPNKANASDLRYTLPDSGTAISTASSEVVSGETVYYGAATLADRTQNQVFVLVALDELRVTIPPAVSGKVRDFGLIVGVGLGEGTALAAPALVPVAPTGETITMMNADGEMPTLADGTTTASGFTVLYFTEISYGAFLVKGEQVEEVA